MIQTHLQPGGEMSIHAARMSSSLEAMALH